MRNTTKVVAALAAVAASLAFGVSQASALSWSTGPGAANAVAVGSLTFSYEGRSYTSTCSNAVLATQLSNSTVNGVARATWSFMDENYLDCWDSRGYPAQMTVAGWFVGDTATSGGSGRIMTMQPTAMSYWPGPFYGSQYLNLSPGTITLDLVNGNPSTPTKIVFNNDRVGTIPGSGGSALYATGELQLLDAWTGGLITLN